MTHYNILDIPSNATEVDIKKAYRKLSFKYHPDRNSSADAEDQIRKINEAYEILGDDSKRKQYDMELKFGNNPFAHFTSDIPFMRMPTMNSSDGDINELFSALFAGAMGRDSPNIRIFQTMGLRKPESINKTIVISFEQAYNGCSLPIEIERNMVIGDLNITEEETLYVNIYPGIDNNEYIIIHEKGNVLNEQLKGDVKICIQIDTSNAIFKRQGLDLIYYKSISLKESLCGFSFKINHLNGKEIMFNNNTNQTVVKPNFKKVIPNMGMNREHSIGNLIIIFDIVFPDYLEPNQIEALNTLL